MNISKYVPLQENTYFKLLKEMSSNMKTLMNICNNKKSYIS